MRLVHQGQAVYGETDTTTMRTEQYTFFFGDNRDLVHAFDRRTDPQEEKDLWATDGRAPQSVEHSVRDGEEK
jgi:hypothetical protein